MSVLGLRNTSLHLLEFIFEAPDVPGLLQKNFICYSNCRSTITFALFRLESSEFELALSVESPGRNSRQRPADNKRWHWRHEQEGSSVRVFLRDGTESDDHMYSVGGQFEYRLGQRLPRLKICGFLSIHTKVTVLLRSVHVNSSPNLSVQTPIASQSNRSNGILNTTG